MAENQIRILIRKKETAGSYPIPADAFLGEPFLNTYDGILLFSGSPGGTYQPSAGQPGVFEVGSTVSVLKALSGINLNNKFVVTATTGQITTYAGQTNFTGQFLSGTSVGFVLAPISSISSASAGNGGDVQYNNGAGGFGANSSFNFSSNTLFTPYLKVSNSISAATIYSGSTNLYDIFLTQASNDITRVQPGSNISTGGTANYPIVSLVSSPSVNNITISGTSTITTASITILSAGTIVSGSTNLSNLFASQSVTNLINAQLFTKANLSGATFNGAVVAQSFSGVNFSGGSFYGNGSQLTGILNFYTTGATLNNNILSFNRNDLLNAYNVNLSGLANYYWSSGSTGLYSLKALNGDTDATGMYSFAVGYDTYATADFGIAMGKSAMVQNNGNYGAVIGGDSNTVNGELSGVFVGQGNNIGWSANSSIVIGGNSNIVEGSVSAIIGGFSNLNNALGAVILGGNNITASTDNTTYVPYFNIQSATTNNALTNILVKNNNGDIYLRDASTILTTTLPWSAITSTPSTISGYGITNAYTKTEIDAKILKIRVTGITSSSAIDSFSDLISDGVRWDYVVKSSAGVNRRVGSISATWDYGTNAIEFVEHSSVDIGNTDTFFFNVAINSNNVEIVAEPTSGTWDVILNRFLI